MAKTGANTTKNGKRNGAKQHGDYPMPQGGRRAPGGVMPPGMFVGDGPMGPNGMGVGDMFGPSIDPTEKIAAAVGTALDKGQIARIKLTQKVSGGEQPVAEWDSEEIEGQDPDSIAQMIYLRALEDVDGSGGLSRFVVQIYRPGATTSLTRTWFRLAAEDLDSVAESEDPATPAGMLSQSWRHNEALMKLSLSTALEGQRLLSRELARITEQNERFEARHVEWIVAREALADRSAVRQLQVKAGEAQLMRAEVHKSLRDQTVLWAMGLAASRFGIPLPPGLVALFTGGAKTQQAQMQAAAGQQQQQQPHTWHLTAEQVAQLGRVASAVLEKLTALPQAMRDLLLARLPEPDRVLVTGVIAESAAQEQGGNVEPNHRRLAEYQGLVCGLLGGMVVDDATVTALVAQLPAEVQTDAAALRETLTAMRTTPQAPSPTNGGQPLPTANGAPAAATAPNGAS
jgi:hypothetical protein